MMLMLMHLLSLLANHETEETKSRPGEAVSANIGRDASALVMLSQRY
jgi:hypothetical protein